MKRIIFYFGLLILFVGCKKENNQSPEEPNPQISAAKLIFPYQNSLCNIGTNITPTESTVLFEWEPGENADSYELVLKDLLTGTFTHHNTPSEEISIVLLRDNPYKWYVISRSEELSDTAHSESWKFYNAGASVQTHPPFPAEAVSPAMASSIIAPSNLVTLSWIGSDADNDITGYDVYFGNANTPPLMQANVTENMLENLPVISNTIYYWKIITKDSNGNESDSGVFQFKVL